MCWSLLGVKGLKRAQNKEMTGLSFGTQRSGRINAGDVRWGYTVYNIFLQGLLSSLQTLRVLHVIACPFL